MSRFSPRRMTSALVESARFLGWHLQRLVRAIAFPFRAALEFLQLGRIFRRLGLPLWTFIGIGAAGWWFDNAGILIETLINQWLGEENGGFAAYLAPLILFLIPFLVVVAIALWHRLRRIVSRSHSSDNANPDRPPPPDGSHLARGKVGIILLVSRTTSAMHSIRYHFLEKETLKYVWLIPSNDKEKEYFGGSSLAIAEEIEHRCANLEREGQKLRTKILPGVSPADSQDTFDIVNRIFRNYDGNANDIVADFTGGTKPMTVGMIMACLPGDRELEYVAYNPVTQQMMGPFVIHYQHSAFDLIG
ncbi:MAG: hypothetical protein AAGA60_31210 [Cyanobacteria bacterium P01_E01_bin.42]